MSDQSSNPPPKNDRPFFLPTFSFSRKQAPPTPNDDTHTHSMGWLSGIFGGSPTKPSPTEISAPPAPGPNPDLEPISPSSDRPAKPRPQNLADTVADKWNEFEHVVKHVSPSALKDDVDIAKEMKKVAARIERDMNDVIKHPEIERHSEIRRGLDLCPEEENFIAARRHKIATSHAFADFIGVNHLEVREEDIPVIGIAAAGGGYRAMIATAGFLKGAEKTGLLASTFYISGVSGATWCLAPYYSVAGCDLDKLITHFQNRLSTHPTDTGALTKILQTEGLNYYFLQGIVQKHRTGVPISPVDLYGTLLGGRLLFESDDPVANPIDPLNFKLSAQRRFIKDGDHPMPIYTAVRHERPWKDVPKHDVENIAAQLDESKLHDIDWWNWIEFTPYEIGCEELEAYTPTWAFGSHFEAGAATDHPPEQSLSLLIGIFGSVFCATLGDWYETVKSFLPDGWVKQLLDETTGTFKKGLGELKTRELAATYLVHASDNPNFIYHLPEPVSLKVPKAIIDREHLGMVDGGIDNNIPFNPFLSPRRHVDVIIALDNATPVDPSDLFERAAKYAQKQRVPWPSDAVLHPDVQYPLLTKEQREKEKKDREEARKAQEEGKNVPTPMPKREPPQAHGMDYALVFDGPSNPLSLPDPENHIEVLPKLQPDGTGSLATIHKTVIYVPLLPNPEHDPSIDPSVNDYCSTWNLRYEPDQVKRVADLAESDMLKATDKIRQAVKAQWERKKKLREDREAKGLASTRLDF